MFQQEVEALVKVNEACKNGPLFMVPEGCNVADWQSSVTRFCDELMTLHKTLKSRQSGYIQLKKNSNGSNALFVATKSLLQRLQSGVPINEKRELLEIYMQENSNIGDTAFTLKRTSDGKGANGVRFPAVWLIHGYNISGANPCLLLPYRVYFSLHYCFLPPTPSPPPPSLLPHSSTFPHCKGWQSCAMEVIYIYIYVQQLIWQDLFLNNLFTGRICGQRMLASTQHRRAKKTEAPCLSKGCHQNKNNEVGRYNGGMHVNFPSVC